MLFLKNSQIDRKTPATLLNQRTLKQVISCEFCEMFKNIYFIEAVSFVWHVI